MVLRLWEACETDECFNFVHKEDRYFDELCRSNLEGYTTSTVRIAFIYDEIPIGRSDRSMTFKAQTPRTIGTTTMETKTWSKDF